MMRAADDMTGLDDGTGVLKRLRRRKGWFAAVFVVVLALVVVVLAALPRTYRASAQLIVASDETLVGGANQPQTQRAVGDPADLESQTMLLRSARLMGGILERPAVQAALLAECEATRASSWTDEPRAVLAGYLPDLFEEQKPCAETLSDRQNALGRLDGGFGIGGVGRSRVLDVSFTSALPQTAAVVTNALVDAYLAEDRSRKVDTREEAIAWLNGEIRRSGDELRRAEIALENNRRQAGIVRGQQASISSERLSSLSQQLIEAQAARAQAASRIAQSGGGSDSSREVLDNRVITDLKQQIATVSAQYAQLAARYGDGYPQLAGLQRQQRELQRRIDQEGQRVTTSLTRDRDAATARVADLTRQLETAKIDVGDTTGAEASIATLVRDVEVRREMFVDLSKKVNELETERRLIGGDARLVSYAEVPTKLWFPKKTPFLAMGIMVAAILAAAAALLRDRADHTVRGAIGIAQISGVPVIGHIPRVGRLPSPKQVEQPSALQESIRALFGQCVLMSGTTPRVLLLTSSHAGEGKTFTTLALAHFAASTGRRVLAVECDLRRPSFGTSMRLPPKPGLSEYLRGEVGFADIVISQPGKPDVIAAGSPAIDSMELLSNGRIDELLRYARSAYDLVIIDSPPSEMLMDARVLAKRADGVIYCASWGQSHSEAVLEGIRGMEQAGGRVLGLAVGMVRESEYPLYDTGTSRPSPYLIAPDAA